MSSVDKTMNNLELAKLDYHDAVINRHIEQGKVTKDKTIKCNR